MGNKLKTNTNKMNYELNCDEEGIILAIRNLNTPALQTGDKIEIVQCKREIRAKFRRRGRFRLSDIFKK